MMIVQLAMLAIAGMISSIYAYSQKHKLQNLKGLIRFLFAGYAIINILFMVFLWFNHAGFPLNLEAMELTELQHLKRIIAGLPLYPEPTADFIALAYNPLYYYLCVPFAWIFGANLLTMRLVAILGMFGSGVMIFLVIRKCTNSYWWALMATGLFAAAYQVMDTYLDNAHRDSWLLFVILFGCYLIDENQSTIKNILGLLCLVTGFWLKQQGSVFVIGAVLYLTWGNGWRKSWLFWILAAVFGPGLYFAAPDWLFGSYFHYFTWQVPRQWTELTPEEIIHFIQYTAKYYLVLAISACISTGMMLQRSQTKKNIWYFMFPIALVSGLLATISPGSNNNVFIPMGVWLIIVGTMGLKQLTDSYRIFEKKGLHLLGLALSFILFFYNPLTVISSPNAGAAYQDLVTYLESLNGTVYAPWLGQLQDGYKLFPAAHWVPLEDIIRKPKVELRNHPTIRQLLQPVLNPSGNAYILHNWPLEEDFLLSFLSEKYVLETDLKERFQALQTLPKRYTIAWPRYLYRYAPQQISK